MAKRDPLWDIVKGLGILLVVWGHSGIQLGHYIIYMFHMPLFFFASGALHKNKATTQAVKRKAVSFGKPYLLFFCICTFADIVMGTYPWRDINILEPKGSAGPLWFLICLFEIYTIFTIAMNATAKMASVTRNAVLIGMSVAMSLSGYWLSIKNIHLPLYLDDTLSSMIFYTLGYYVRPLISGRLAPKTNCVIAIVSALAIYGMYIIDFSILHLSANDLFSNTIMESYPLFFLSASVGIIFILSFSNILIALVPKISGYIAYLGCFSLYIFALHMFALNLCRKVYDTEAISVCAFYCVLATLLSLVIKYLLERFCPKLIK